MSVSYLRGDAFAFDVNGENHKTLGTVRSKDKDGKSDGFLLLRDSFSSMSVHSSPRELRPNPSMNRDPTVSYVLPPRAQGDYRKYTVVLDLDETLVYGRSGPLYARPGLDELLMWLGQHCETVVWTAGERAYAQRIIRSIDTDGVIEHCIYRHPKWYDDAGYWKDLTLCGRDVNYTLLIDNSPNCIRGQATHSVLVSDFWGDSEDDLTLPAIQRLLSDLVRSGQKVHDWLPKNKSLSKRMVSCKDGNEVYLYYLDLINASQIMALPRRGSKTDSFNQNPMTNCSFHTLIPN